MIKKNIFIYVFIVGIFASLIWLILEKGKTLKASTQQVATATAEHNNPDASALKPAVAIQENLFESFAENLKHPISILFLQIVVILIVSRLFGMLAHAVGQPTVIGEIIAGIFLGPSLLGMLFPGFSFFLFPVESLNTLQFFSQVGLVFFMFIVGMELDVSILKKKAQDAVVVSHASIIVPYFLGMVLAYFIYERYAPANISFLSFSLFMGIAMSITAFPVLARILQEKGLTKTPLGTLAITCAAAGDVTAWCILPAVIAIAKSESISGAIITIGFSLLYVLLMLYVIKPMIAKIGAKYGDKESKDKTIIAVAFVVLLGSAYVSELIGIHVLFGAFLAGVIMPPGFSFKNTLTEKIEDVSLLLLLPIFFVFTGLRTQIGLLNETHLWLLFLVVMVAAIAGKFGGSALAAKLVGHNWKDALSLGALLNTRGLMELIILNIGYDLNILTPEIFTIMVLMAVTTTFMTGPCLQVINQFFDKEIQVID